MPTTADLEVWCQRCHPSEGQRLSLLYPPQEVGCNSSWAISVRSLVNQLDPTHSINTCRRKAQDEECFLPDCTVAETGAKASSVYCSVSKTRNIVGGGVSCDPGGRTYRSELDTWVCDAVRRSDASHLACCAGQVLNGISGVGDEALSRSEALRWRTRGCDVHSNSPTL